MKEQEVGDRERVQLPKGDITEAIRVGRGAGVHRASEQSAEGLLEVPIWKAGGFIHHFPSPVVEGDEGTHQENSFPATFPPPHPSSSGESPGAEGGQTRGVLQVGRRQHCPGIRGDTETPAMASYGFPLHFK